MADELTYDAQEWDEQAIFGPSTVIAAFDRIEELAREARSVPLSATIMVNKAELLDLIAQAREALPDDLAAADAVVADADAVLGRADSAAEVTIAEAIAEANALVKEATDKAKILVRDAEDRAQRLLDSAHNEAENLTTQAERESQAILDRAHAQAERMVSQENIMSMAEDRARTLVDDAQTQAQQMKHGADEYAAQCLTELSSLLHDMQRRTDAGRRAIADRSGIDRTDIAIND